MSEAPRHDHEDEDPDEPIRDFDDAAADGLNDIDDQREAEEADSRAEYEAGRIEDLSDRPLLERAGVSGFPRTGYIAPAIESINPTETVDPDYVKAGEVHARDTYDKIVSELQDHRCNKDDLQTRINELVEQERIWGPIIRRLDTGIVHRKPDDEQESLLDNE